MKKFIVLTVAVASLVGFVGCGGEAAEVPDVQDPGADAAEIGGGVKDAAISGAGGNVAVDAGFAGDGTFIQIPAGFSASQCKFTAAAATIDGDAISIQVSINRETGEVVCEKVVQERTEIPPEVQGCTASYTVICVK